MEKSKNKLNTEPLNITEALLVYARHWKWFVGSITICLIIGVCVFLASPRQYKTSLSILLNEDQNKGVAMMPQIDIEALGISTKISNIENEIILLSSPDLVLQVVKKLNLQTFYYVKDRLRKAELFDAAPFTVYYKKESDDISFNNIHLSLEKESSGFRILGRYVKSTGEEINIQQTGQNLPVIINLPDSLGTLEILATGKSVIPSKKYYVEIENESQVTAGICSGLLVYSPTKASSVVNINVITGNSEKGAAILKELINQYNELHVTVNNQIAINTSAFVNERLTEISVELGDVEDEVVDYKQKNKITDLGSEAQLFVQQIGQNEQKLVEIETQLNIITLIEKFIKDPDNKHALIPNLEVADPGLSQIIVEYNQNVLYLNQLIKKTGQANPLRIRLTEQIDNTRTGIANSLKNVKEAYRITRDNLQKQSDSTQNRIESVPQQERRLLEKVRLQRVKETLFLFLMQKREETAMAIASSVSKARIVVSPSSMPPIAPGAKKILLVSFVIGFILPIVGIYIRQLLRNKIGNLKDLERQSRVDIIGHICKNKTNDKIVIGHGNDTSIAEMFRALRNRINLMFKLQDKKVISVTSTKSNEGKTFISLNLALSFSLQKKKVLLISVDIRNSMLSDYMGLYAKRGLTDYLIDTTSDDSSNYIQSLKGSKYLDVLTSGTNMLDPNELLMNPKLEILFAEARKKYDIIVLDTAPVGLVSDTYLISEFTDLTLYVVREDVTPKVAVNFINKQKEEELLHNMYLILNDTHINNEYGY